MNAVKKLKILLKSSIMTKEVSRKIKHNAKNLIDLDSTEEDGEVMMPDAKNNQVAASVVEGEPVVISA